MRICLKCGEAVKEATGWRCPACSFVPQEKEGVALFAPDYIDNEEAFDHSAYTVSSGVIGWHFWFRHYAASVMWAVGAFFPSATRYFEAGCGTGYLLRAILDTYPDLHVAGGELSWPGILHTQKLAPSTPLFQIDARNLPFHEEFDLIGSFDVIEHIEDDRAALLSMARALTPNGGLIVCVPQHPGLWSAHDDYSRHVRRYTHHELAEKMNDAGFEVIHATSLFAMTLPFLLASLARERLFKPTYDFKKILSLPRPVNALLLALCKAELALVRAHVRFPAGGTLMMIGKKK